MKKAFLSLLLTAVLVLGMLPTALATENAETPNVAPGEELVYISNVEELAAFRDAVNNGNDFAGVTVYLTADIDLDGYTEFNVNYQGNNLETSTFRPIGEDTPFAGTFDGQGFAIKNLYQNGWDLNYEWGKYGSLGLFAEIRDATIKNLTIEGALLEVEGGDVAAITGSATGTCVFENITIEDSVMATYNNGCGSIIAWSGAGNYTFKDITIADDVVLAGLWGSFDSSIGGVVGQAEPGASYDFQNVDIACRIDAYNDCTASYDYYNYRMCGMIMGRLEETTTIDGRNYPDTSKYNITCENVTVTYGDWYAYHYCDPTPGLNGGRGMRVEPGHAYDGLPADYDHSQCTTHHGQVMPFDQLFGGDQYAVDGLPTYDGVEVNYPADEKDHGLQDIVNDADNGDTIVLTEDFCEDCGAIVGKNIIVDGTEGEVISVDTDKAFVLVADGSVSIIGGTYANKPDNYVAEGYKAYDLQDGTWAVKPEDATVTVIFESDGETVGEQVIPYAGKASSVCVDRRGYDFKGWYLNNKLFDFDTIITSDITLTAKWAREPSPVTIKTVEKTVINRFVDVADDAYYTKAVLWALEEGITTGTGTVTFSPDAVCTRAQVVTFLWRAAGCPEPVGAANEFDDVDSNAYYAKAVQWAVEQGITLGTGDNKFSPDAECTRGQIVTFLWRSQGTDDAYAYNPFVDVADDAYYTEAVLWTVENDITNGTGATTFSPDADCTRGQIVTFLYRCLAE